MRHQKAIRLLVVVLAPWALFIMTITSVTSIQTATDMLMFSAAWELGLVTQLQ